MKKQNQFSSSQTSLQRTGVRLLSDVTAMPSRIHRHVIKPIQTSTGDGFNAARRAMAPVQACTVGSVAAFVAAVLALDDKRGPHAA